MKKLNLFISIALICATFFLLYFAPSKAQNVLGQGLQESFSTNGSQALFGAQFPFSFVQKTSFLQLQATPLPTTRISADQGKYIIVETPSGKTIQGHSYEKPPPQPRPKDEEGDERGQPSAPLIDDGLTILPQQTKETNADGIHQPLAPGTFTIFRNSGLTGTLTSSVNEPSVGSQGDGIFLTHNWSAEVSTNNGTSFSYIDPAMFPNTPAAFSHGFCCDQRVAQDSGRNLIFWYLQYSTTGTDSTSTNGVRVAVAHGQNGLATNTWTYYDITPNFLGLPVGKWLDFPHMQVSANFLYLTTNIYETTSGRFYGSMVLRMPLSQLDGGLPVTIQGSLFVNSFAAIMAVNGASVEGSRPARTTMYFASVSGTTSLKILTWPEANNSPSVFDVTNLATTYTGTYVCPGPDALDPCTRANERVQTGWITDNELGIMWTSAQNPPGRPFPHTRVAILNPSTLAVISQPDII